MKSLWPTLGALAVLGVAALGCRTVPPAALPVAPASPPPLLTSAFASASLTPPAEARAFADRGSLALPEPPPDEPLPGVSLRSAQAGRPGLDAAGRPLRLVEQAKAPAAATPGLGKPEAPPRGAAKAAPVPPTGAAKAAPAPAPGPAKAALAPVKPPAVASSATPARQASTSGATLPKTAPPAAAAPREVFARAGDPIEIAFDGRGWLYLGLPAAEASRGEGITFLGGTSPAGRSIFSFKALETGRYTLRFQLQDNAVGGRREEVVALRVVSGQEFEEFQARLAAAAPQPLAEPAPADPQRVAAADRLFSLGEYGQAVTAFLEGYREGDPYLNDRIGASYGATGDHLAAVKYYRKNLGAPEPFSSRATAGLVRAAVATADTALLLEQLPALLQGAEVGPELLAVGRWQAAAGHYSLAQEVLREYVRRYPVGRGLEEAWFLLAQILEAESPWRDLQAARDLYDRVYEQFPESPLAVRAQARRDYLDRHFFQIR